MRLSFEIAGSQIDGARDYQEDAFLITHLGDSRNPNSGSLVIVADGMGGHAAGNVAANMAVQRFNQHLTRNYPSPTLSLVLKECVNQSNQAIAATVREANVLKGMGCTLIGALFDRAGMHYASVGDSHLYLVRGDEIKKTNADHSYGGYLDRMAAAGQPVAADPTLTRNMLLSALTGENIMEVDCPENAVDIKPGDRILICTDGMDSLDTEEILQISKSAITAKSCVEKLLSAVKKKNVPRQDNTTVVTIDIRGDLDKPGTAKPVVQQTVEEPPARSSHLGAWLSAVAGLGALAAAAYWYYPTLANEFANLAQHVDAGPTSAPRPTPASVTTVPEVEQTGTPVQAQQTPSAIRTMRDTLRDGSKGPELVIVPSGTYQMGASRIGADYDEQPAHSVTLSEFAIMRYELTVSEYEKFATPKAKVAAGQRHDKMPVTMLSWDDAGRYAKWLSEQTGKKYRLPTEAEWEYAAAAGTTTTFWWGVKPQPNRAYCHACAPGLAPDLPVEIGRFAHNPFGLFDTAGNVAEWVQDCYNLNYENAPADGAAVESENCNQRVVRGGSFSSPPKSLRTSKRMHFAPERGYDDIGVRLARDP